MREGKCAKPGSAFRVEPASGHLRYNYDHSIANTAINNEFTCLNFQKHQAAAMDL